MLAEVVPLYPLYALLFADTGLSGARISTLLLIWSTVGIVAEVPLGALADRYSRRGSLVASDVLQAAGYVLWVALPGFTGFAAGFVLWGLGGALCSGAREALLYDGLAHDGDEARYARISGRLTAVGLLAHLPGAALATLLFAVGGYPLVGWASVGCCLATAFVASRLPEPPRTAEDSYVAALRAGLAEVVARPVVRRAAVAAALLGGVDALEEFFPLLARDWAVPVPLIPIALVGVSLAGAAGAASGGAAARWRPVALKVVLGCAGVALAVACVARQPWGLAVLAACYGLYRGVVVVADARLQERIEGPARATVTSVASLGTELAALLVYAAWAGGGGLGVAVLIVVLAVVS